MREPEFYWKQIEIHEILSAQNKMIIVFQRSYGVSVCGDIQNPTVHGHRQPALAGNLN